MFSRLKFLLIIYLSSSCQSQDVIMIENTAMPLQSGQSIAFQKSQIYYPQTCDEYFKDFPQKTEGKIFVNGVTTSCSKDKVESLEISSSKLASETFSAPIEIISSLSGNCLIVIDENKLNVLTITLKDLSNAAKKEIHIDSNHKGHCIILDKYSAFINSDSNTMEFLNLDTGDLFSVKNLPSIKYSDIIQLVALPDIDGNSAQILSYGADTVSRFGIKIVAANKGFVENYEELFEVKDVTAIDFWTDSIVAVNKAGMIVLRKSSGKIIEYNAHHDDINDVAFLNDNLIATGGKDSKVKIYNIAENKITFEYEYTEGNPRTLTKISDDTFAAGGGTKDKTVRVFDTTGKCTLIINHDEAIKAITTFDDTFIFADKNSKIFIYE